MLKNMRILLRDSDGKYQKLGKADASEDAETVVIYFETNKATRHRDGNFYAGPVGPDTPDRLYELRVPTSEVTAEALLTVSVSPEVTVYSQPYEGPKVEPGEAFVFPSAALEHKDVKFGAELVDMSLVDQRLELLNEMSGVLSASTYHEAGIGKAVLMYVTHSTGLSSDTS